MVTVLIPVIMLVMFFVVPRTVDFFFGQALAVRMAVAVAVLLPLAVLVAVPFPRAMDWAKLRLGGDHEAGLLYAVDSAFAVLGVAGSAALSTMIGFNQTYLVAMALYAMAALMFVTWKSQPAGS